MVKKDQRFDFEILLCREHIHDHIISASEPCVPATKNIAIENDDDRLFAVTVYSP
jgi:hypothetical protein